MYNTQHHLHCFGSELVRESHCDYNLPKIVQKGKQSMRARVMFVRVKEVGLEISYHTYWLRIRRMRHSP